MQRANEASVRLEGVPARLFIESQNHQHDVIRELVLMDLGERFELVDRELPQRVALLIAEILEEYADVRSATREQAVAALQAGDETVDLDVPTRDGIVEALQRWLRLVEEADDFCRAGVLLTPAAPPEVAGLRRWYAEAVARGVTGASVVRYPAAASERR